MDFIESFYFRPNSIKTQKSLFNKWIQPELHLRKTHSWEDLTGYLVNHWSQNNLSPRTIKSLLSLLKKYVSWVTGGGTTLDTSKWTRLIMRSQQQKPIKALTRAQAREVMMYIENMQDDKLHTLCMLAYHAGLRKGEAFGLRWEDVDLEKERLFIQRSYNGPTKNGKSRFVPISYPLKQVLLDELEDKTDNYLETNVISKQFDPNHKIRKACRMAQCPEITIHGFRHTFATLALDSGRSVKQVSEVLGHTSVSITMDVYWSNVQGEMDLGFL